MSLIRSVGIGRVGVFSSRRRGGGRASSIMAVVLIALSALCCKWYFGGEGVSPARAGDAGAGAQSAPSVVYRPVQRADLALSREYVGHVEAIQRVSIRPQVAGEIDQVHFTEGSIVNEGDDLFTIDTRQYKATYDLRQADVARAKANYDYAVKFYNRLKASDSRSVSATDLEAAQSNVAQTKAAVDQANAALKLAKIDLDYCRIKAPITGQIGQAVQTRGNYVTPAGGELASIVQIDPIRVSFSVSDRDYLANIEAFKASSDDVFVSQITLPDGHVYPMDGRRDFEDNTMDGRTGTMTMRVRFPNDKGVLVPGTVVRVNIKPITSHVACVIPQAAVISTPQGDAVYVIDAEDKIEARLVELGEDIGQMVEAVKGLEEGERIVIRGVQNVRPGMKVSPNPEKAEGEGSTPAELAQESGYDLMPVRPEAE